MERRRCDCIVGDGKRLRHPAMYRIYMKIVENGKRVWKPVGWVCKYCHNVVWDDEAEVNVYRVNMEVNNNHTVRLNDVNNAENGSSLNVNDVIRIDEKGFQTYIKLKEASGKRPQTVDEYFRKVSRFLKVTNWTLSRESILDYIDDISKLKKRRKHATIAMDFLRFIASQKGYNVEPYIKLLDRVEAPKEEKKLYAEEDEDVYLLTLEDIHKALREIVEIGKGGVAGILRDVSCITLLASTGIRSQEVCWLKVNGAVDPGITKAHIDLSKDHFILPSYLSKTHTKRVIPLHPDAKLTLKAYYRQHPHELLWNYSTVQKTVNKTTLGSLKRLRKFFVKMSKQIGFDQIKRVAIMGHDEEELLKLKVTEEFYEKYTPQEICREYFEKWGKVEILPEDVRAYVDKFADYD